MTVTSEVVALCIGIVGLKPEDKPVRAPLSLRLYIGHFVNWDSCRGPHCCQSYNNPGPEHWPVPACQLCILQSLCLYNRLSALSRERR